MCVSVCVSVFFKKKITEIIYHLQKRTTDKKLLSDMAKQVDHSGFTPLIQACFEYKSWKVSNVVV